MRKVIGSPLGICCSVESEERERDVVMERLDSVEVRDVTVGVVRFLSPHLAGVESNAGVDLRLFVTARER